jgi:hypothetical protein
MASVCYLTAKFTSPTAPAHAAVFLAASVCVIAAGRLADRLWDSTTAPALGMRAAWLRAVARYPYRLLGGAIAFSAVLLTAKRSGFIPLRDVPVIEIFAAGAVLSAGYHAAGDAWRSIRRRAGADESKTHERNGE